MCNIAMAIDSWYGMLRAEWQDIIPSGFAIGSLFSSSVNAALHVLLVR